MNPNQAVFAGSDVGRVVFYDPENFTVKVLHRKNDYTWYERTYTEEAVTPMSQNLPWDLNTPFMTKKYIPRTKSWLDNFWALLTT